MQKSEAISMFPTTGNNAQDLMNSMLQAGMSIWCTMVWQRTLWHDGRSRAGALTTCSLRRRKHTVISSEPLQSHHLSSPQRMQKPLL